MRKKKDINRQKRKLLKHTFNIYLTNIEQNKDLNNLFTKHADKIKQLLSDCPSWLDLYNLPFNTLIAVAIYTFGMWDDFAKATKEDRLLDYLKGDDQKNTVESDDYFDQLNDLEKGIFISVYMALSHNIKCMQVYSKSLNKLLAEANESDMDLLNAILIDRSLVSAPIVAKRIRTAVATGDEPFLTELSKTLKRERPFRIKSDYDRTRLLKLLADETAALADYSIDEIYDFFVIECNAFPGEYGNSLDAFRKFYSRTK